MAAWVNNSALSRCEDMMDTRISHAGLVAHVKKTYSHEYLKAQHALGVQVRHYKEWDKTDLKALSDSFFGKTVFNQLISLVVAAHQEEAERLRAPLRRMTTYAQNDLNEIAPRGLNWKSYSTLIAEVVAEIRASGFAFKPDHLPTRDELFAIAPVFDHQSALSWMEDSEMQAVGGMEESIEDAFAAA